MKLKRALTLLVLLNCLGLFSQINLSDGLLLHYNFNNNVMDQSGNGNNGSSVGGSNYTNDFAGVPSNAIEFNGTNSYININSFSNTLKPTQFPVTIAAWVKNNQENGKANVIFKNDYAQNIYSGIRVQIGPITGRVALNFEDGGPIGAGSRKTKIGNTNINDNQWHFVACIIRGANDMEIYIDCNNDGGTYSGDGGNISYTNNSGAIGVYDRFLGNTQSQDYYKGGLDELRFYNRELNANELRYLAMGFSNTIFDFVNYNPNNPDFEITYGNPVLNTFTGNIFWNLGDGTQSQELSGVHQYNTAGPYNVSLQLIANGCTLSYDTTVFFNAIINPEDTSVSIEDSLFNITPDLENIKKTVDGPLIIPNSFSPDKDGINDLFVIKNSEYYPNLSLIIYNRWGIKILEENPYGNNWNGGNVTDGTYLYLIDDGKGKMYKGSLTILRMQ